MKYGSLMISYHTKVSESERSSSDDDILLVVAYKDNNRHVTAISSVVLLLSPYCEVEWAQLVAQNH